MTIDVHTHAFPDDIAETAMNKLTAEVPDCPAYLNGTVADLIKSMDAANIIKSVVCSIATKPTQFEPIFNWSKEIFSDRIIPFPSIHPSDKQWEKHLEMISEHGFRGIKMHPYYQEFYLDEQPMLDIAKKVSDLGLVLIMHTGFDVAFERIDRAGPQRILNLVDKCPELKLVSTHMGGWQQWDQVNELLIGKPIYMETSFCQDYINRDMFRQMLANHPTEYLMFGSDSPWKEQKASMDYIKTLPVTPENIAKIMGQNAQVLLDV